MSAMHARPRSKAAAALARLSVALAALSLVHVGAIGCLRVEHGVVVELWASALPTGGAGHVFLHDGTELVIDSGELVVAEARLLPCRDATARAETFLRALLGPARAAAQHDHHTSPFSLIGPLRVALAGPPSLLGAFTPPPGRYCGVHVELGGAPSAAERPETLTVSLVAHATDDGREVIAQSALPGAVHLELDEPRVLHRAGTTRLHASFYEERPFAALPALIEGADELGAALVRGAAAQGAIRVEPIED